MNNALERAKKGLQFEDIFQTAVSARLKDNFDPKFDTTEAYSAQLKQHVKQSNILAIKNTEQSFDIFRIYIDVGVRLICADSEESKSEALAQLEASYCVEYIIVDPALSTDQEALDEFALKNACYHLWPYWREYVMSQCTRMNLPKMPLPFHFISSQVKK